MKKITIFTLVLCSMFALAGCRDKGALEKAGERADEIVDNVKDGDPVLHEKGAMEKVGEGIDDAVKDVTDKK